MTELKDIEKKADTIRDGLGHRGWTRRVSSPLPPACDLLQPTIAPAPGSELEPCFRPSSFVKYCQDHQQKETAGDYITFKLERVKVTKV